MLGGGAAAPDPAPVAEPPAPAALAPATAAAALPPPEPEPVVREPPPIATPVDDELVDRLDNMEKALADMKKS